MIKILQRYLASNFIIPFMMASVFFVSFLLTFQLFRIIRLVIAKGVDVLTLMELIGHIAISFLPMAYPLAALFAMIYAMNKLSEDSEVVAMRSFGMTKFQIFTPFLIIGIFLGGSIFALNRNLIPYSQRVFKNTIIKLSSKGMLGNIKSEQFFIDIPNVTLFANKVTEEGRKLEDVFIHFKESAGEGERIIMAKKGALIKEDNSKGVTSSLRLHLFDGNIFKYNEEKSDSEKYIFKEYDFPIFSNSVRPGFITKDRMRTSEELKELLNKNEKIFNGLTQAKVKRKLSKKEESQYNALKSRLPKTQIEYWSRINTPIQVIMFILLGFVLGIKKGRGRSKNTGAIGIGVLIGYYVLFFGGVSLARSHVLSSELVVFLPTILTGVIGIYFYRKVDWAS